MHTIYHLAISMNEAANWVLAISVLALVAVLCGVIYGVKKLKEHFTPDRTCLELLETFFAPHPLGEIKTYTRRFPERMRIDLQKALRAAIADATQHHYSGVKGEYAHENLSLSGMFTESNQSIKVSNLVHEEVDIGENEPVRCVNQALWLLEKAGLRCAVLLAPNGHFGQTNGINIEIGVPEDPKSETFVTAFFKALEKGVAEAGSYRGKVLSLENSTDYRGQAAGLRVLKIRPVDAEGIILPKETLAQIDRNILDFIKIRKRLAERGLSAKKGLLFYGPPGTGKTLTIHYLIHALKGHTFLIVTAEQQGLIDEYMQLARLLQPAVLVIEDADLIAKARGSGSNNVCVESVLNKMLNEMDGLRPDAEIIFILTTNLPEVLEPALIARPGRIDQAIKFPLPDEACRARLVRLYAGQVHIGDELIATIARRTEGVSAAFIKEFIRRSAQYALDAGREEEIAADDVEEALQDMLRSRGGLQGRLLGAGGEEQA